MRYISKRIPPVELTEWKQLANADWEPTWANFRGSPKQATHGHLVIEQGHICCYCGQRIVARYTRDEREKFESSHIEHLRPRSKWPDLALSYENMMASCLGKVPKGVPIHCGPAKEDWFSDQMVHPLNKDCRVRLVYTGDGRIHSAHRDDRGAFDTIAKLQRLRKAVIEVFLEPILNGELEGEELSRFVDLLGKPDKDGRLLPFCFAVAQILAGFLPPERAV